MRVLVMPADNTGCGCYRLRWVAEAVAASTDLDVTICGPDESAVASPLRAVVGRNEEVVGMEPLAFDVVVLQRPMLFQLGQAIPFLRAAGVAVVVDMDDDLSSVSPRNAAWSAVHPATSPRMNWQHAAAACRVASLVTVTTPALAERYGGHGRTAVLPNCVPARYLDVVRTEPNDRPTLGWAGAALVHPDDLQVVRGAVAGLTRAGHPFRVVGPQDGVQQALGLPDEPMATGPVSLMEWPLRYAELDVAMVPLAATAFNQKKSWLKGIEAAALGVAFCATATPEYVRLAGEGAGSLVCKERHWAAALRRLLEDAGARSEAAEAGRAAARRWTIEGNAWRWAEAWEKAGRQP